MANAINKNKSITKIGLFEIIGLLLSLLSFYVAVTQLLNLNILNFIVALIAGVAIMPFIWKFIEVKYSFNLSLPLRVIIWIVLMTASIYIGM